MTDASSEGSPGSVSDGGGVAAGKVDVWSLGGLAGLGRDGLEASFASVALMRMGLGVTDGLDFGAGGGVNFVALMSSSLGVVDVCFFGKASLGFGVDPCSTFIKVVVLELLADWSFLRYASRVST